MGEQNVYRISVGNLDEHFVESLREKYPNAALEIKVDASPQPGSLTEPQFWEIIKMLDWAKEGDSDAVIAPVVKHLAEHALRNIFEFQDILSEKLYRLDTRNHAAHSGENAYRNDDAADSFFSPDEFLYARCCVVANGKEQYEMVLQNPGSMPPDMAFGALLRIARLAYEHKTGQPFRYVPAFNIETFSNREGWK